jgi:hypothetical protein
MPVILATQEAEIRKIVIQSQPGNPISKNPSHTHRKRAGVMAQGEGLEFKPLYRNIYIYICIFSL